MLANSVSTSVIKAGVVPKSGAMMQPTYARSLFKAFSSNVSDCWCFSGLIFAILANFPPHSRQPVNARKR